MALHRPGNYDGRVNTTLQIFGVSFDKQLLDMKHNALSISLSPRDTDPVCRCNWWANCIGPDPTHQGTNIYYNLGYEVGFQEKQPPENLPLGDMFRKLFRDLVAFMS